MAEGLSAAQTNDLVWRSDVFGSTCFLVAAVLLLPERTQIEVVGRPAGA